MNLNTGYLLAGGRYRIERVLGQGGFGITYEARDTKFKSRVKSVAIKEFFVKDFCNREQETNRIVVATQSKVELVEKLRNKFTDEANALFELEHPGIVRVTDTFEENNTAYYVMEFVGGGSLSDKVKSGALPEVDALRYICQVATALEFVHGKRMMHLDIKPANILLNENDETVLIDFGLAKQYDESGTQTSTTPVGISHGYAPLEQYKRGGVGTFSPATDIYSLGATLYKLLTGETPPEAGDVMNEGLPRLPQHISASVRAAVEAAMQPRRKDRPQSIGEFLSLLDGNVKAEIGKVKTESNDDGATEILHSVHDDKYREKNSSTNLGEVPQAEGYNPNRASVISTERSDGEISSTNAGETVLLTDDKLSPCSMWTSNEVLAKKWGFVDSTGKLVIPCKYDLAFSFSEGLAGVELDGKYGFVDPTGKLAIPCKYDYAFSFSEGLARVVLDGKWGFVDSTGKLAIPCKYDYAYPFSEGLARVVLGGKSGFVDSTGKLAIPCKYDDAWSFSEGLAEVKLDGKWGFIDPTGKLAIPCKYDGASSFSEGLAEVRLYGKSGFVDSTGKLAIPCKYDWAASFSEGLAWVLLDGKYGFVDSTGKLAIPCKYDYAYPFSEGLARVWLDDVGFYIDKNGKIN